MRKIFIILTICGSTIYGQVNLLPSKENLVLDIEYENTIIIEQNSNIQKSLTTFYSLKTSKNKSVFAMIQRLINTQEGNYFFSSEPGVLEKNFEKNLFSKDEELGERIYLVEDALPFINWQLDEEKDSVILNYKVKFASSSFEDKSIKCWYIPSEISNGPLLYQGVPGIIAYVETVSNNKSNQTIEKNIFTIIKLKESEEIISLNKDKSKAKRIKRYEYLELSKKYYKNLIEYHKQGIDK